MTQLCTNMLRAGLSADLVARLYRFRWQIELCFKARKSYPNLHTFGTPNPHIAGGLIWASVCAAILERFLAHAARRVRHGPAISTRRVAMCAHQILEALVAALLIVFGPLNALSVGLTYPLANSRRANRNRHRLRAGLALMEVAR